MDGRTDLSSQSSRTNRECSRTMAMNSALVVRSCAFPRRLFFRRSMSEASFPVAVSIRAKLTESLKPFHLEVVNESHMHNVPPNSETHFKVVVVSDEFGKVKSPVQRHRLVNAALQQELDGPVHALSIVAKTPEQWEIMQQEGKTVPASPACRGGDGSLPKKSTES